jgi:short-subunit dehydrogenase
MRRLCAPAQATMKKIIIIGATSGMGRELARIYAGAGHLVGATGRRQDLLYSLQLEYPNQLITECFDVTGTGHISYLEALIRKLGGLDLLIYSSGFGEHTEQLDWVIDRRTVDINVNGFVEIMHYAFNYFVRQGHGHLAVLSSIASIRGNGGAPAYSASKAFQSVFFEGLYMKTLHMRAKKGGPVVYVTDVQPGFVDTAMAKAPKRFWVAPPAKAARQIVRAIEKKRWRVYVTRRWWIIAKLMKWMPDFIYHKIW